MFIYLFQAEVPFKLFAYLYRVYSDLLEPLNVNMYIFFLSASLSN